MKRVALTVVLVSALLTLGAKPSVGDNAYTYSWPAGTVVQVNGVLSAEAAAAWSGVSALQVEQGGVVSCGSSVTICEGPVTDGFAGQVLISYDESGTNILSCSVTLAVLSPELAVHEVGHCLGLAHVDLASDCMNPAPVGGCNVDHSADTLRAVYGGDPPAAAVPGTFADTEGNVHEANIECLASLGIAQGYGDGTYGPGDSVTRGQMASLIARTLDSASRGETC